MSRNAVALIVLAGFAASTLTAWWLITRAETRSLKELFPKLPTFELALLLTSLTLPRQLDMSTVEHLARYQQIVTIERFDALLRARRRYALKIILAALVLTIAFVWIGNKI